MRGVTVVFALMLGASSLAHAQDKRAQAVQLADESERAYKAGQFEKAAELLRKAHATFPEPLLLYNLGRALEGMGDTKGAVEAYDQYLNDAKHIDDRPAIERRIATLKAQLDKQREDAAQHEKERLEKERQRNVDEQQAKDQTEKDRLAKEQAEKDRLAKEQAEKEQQQAQPLFPPQLPPPVDDDRTALQTFGPWATLGAGGAMIAAGAVFGWRANVNHDDATTEMHQLAASQLQSAAETDATIANVMFVVGGAAMLAGAVWEYFEWQHGHRATTSGARLRVAPTGLAVEWTLR